MGITQMATFCLLLLLSFLRSYRLSKLVCPYKLNTNFMNTDFLVLTIIRIRKICHVLIFLSNRLSMPCSYIRKRGDETLVKVLGILENLHREVVDKLDLSLECLKL